MENNSNSTASNTVDKDSFNMSSVEECIPNDNQILDSHQETETNEEFFDANESESESEDDFEVDEEELLKAQKDMSEDELEKQKIEALNLKKSGNECFKAGDFKEAMVLYTGALTLCPLKCQNERSILYSNRAAARIGLDDKDAALLDCNKAIELNPDYLRAILRRAQLHKKMDNLDRCLEDYKKVLELDKNNSEARQACATLPAEIAERNEKLKQEMFGKLKDLGNICLKPFGLSTNNFKMVQDPNSGGYSINFQK
ncbi:tetratricopeptide repeat protein 1 [Parasteatoda tepidariorum]|uniref:tetratricopeptide repeat protein 1 n=1 Tax=Parasteatoda tepidariorum TaxID=114398 RepID=UPI00077FB478|nr:tetratricopeptide repeat protein 1 [Parasteatoda tepidariorum]